MSKIVNILTGVAALFLFAVLAWTLISLPDVSPGLTQATLQRLPDTGVHNPVTAVLLNYRGYDTMLEIAVLLLAVIGVWLLQWGEISENIRERPLLPWLLRWLLPPLIIVAGYLLWIGSYAPGGAFQGGALIGGALVLIILSGLVPRFLPSDRMLRILLIAGLMVFIAMAIISITYTGYILGYPIQYAGTFILIIESFALVSIGFTLGGLYFAGRPPAESARYSGDESDA